jgi:hypothetical protein
MNGIWQLFYTAVSKLAKHVDLSVVGLDQSDVRVPGGRVRDVQKAADRAGTEQLDKRPVVSGEADTEPTLRLVEVLRTGGFDG